ncbi:linearmycin resistance permease LnrM [Pseudoduganella ginsengisoli]|uniref:ABC transporter n=1 Tax=Pseudoduganella ginsengisoli TaxID=1462440 RepID=A0A6L6PY08_9BURK|nr:ABC transporter permease [Pseudoduganella ginsengisoli]MTW02069.1 ABC transporter [Pseudoduganella ginsengisoli]
MTAFFALVRKDLMLYLNDKRALMMHLLLPVVLAAFFGSLFGGSGGEERGRIDIALVQEDSSAAARKIADGLKGDSTLHVVDLPLAEAQAKVKGGKLAVAVVIPAGFGEAAGAALFSAATKPELPLFYDPSQSAVLAMVKGILTQHVMQVVSSEMFNGDAGRQLTEDSLKKMPQTPETLPLRELLASLNKFQDSRAALPKAEAPEQKGGLAMPFSTRDEALSAGPKYNGYAHAFAGMSVQFILFMGVDIGIGILLARRAGIWNRLLAAPVTLTTLLLARCVSAAIIACGLLAAIFLCAMLIFKVAITTAAGFAGVAACFALMTAGFGLLIAAWGKTPEAARGIAVFVTLIMVMLGGAWVPSFMFPGWMQSLTLAVPTRWAVDGFDAVTWRGLGLHGALAPMAALLAFAVAFTGLAIWKMRRDQWR